IPGAPCDPLASSQSPYILRKGRRRMLVEVELENREENAYNASLWLHLPGNLHFSSLVLQVQPAGGPKSLSSPSKLSHQDCGPLVPCGPPVSPCGGLLLPPPSAPSTPTPCPSPHRVPLAGSQHGEVGDCSNTWCQELSCCLGRLERGGGASIQLLRTLHDSFFSGVKFRSLRIVSSVWLRVTGSVLVLEEGAQRREV
ncbi:ITA10 protein, partial [Pomatorhinus ruficollis]|nr:ITA10 protein [Pomatorhinus ruficollis]